MLGKNATAIATGKNDILGLEVDNFGLQPSFIDPDKHTCEDIQPHPHVLASLGLASALGRSVY